MYFALLGPCVSFSLVEARRRPLELQCSGSLVWSESYPGFTGATEALVCRIQSLQHQGSVWLVGSKGTDSTVQCTGFVAPTATWIFPGPGWNPIVPLRTKVVNHWTTWEACFF